MNHLATLTFLCFITISCNSQKVNSLNVSEFEKSISQGEKQLLDVRTAAEYNSGHLKKSLQADWYNQKQFKERIGALDKTKPVYLYCLTGARSREAMKWMSQNGFSNAQDLKGGLIAWQKAGKTVEGSLQVKQITLEEYTKDISSAQTVLIDFGAEWCSPCKKMEPIISQLKSESGNKYKAINVDAGVQTSIMKQMNVESLPVFIVYKNGKEVWRKEGVVSIEELKSNL